MRTQEAALPIRGYPRMKKNTDSLALEEMVGKRWARWKGCFETQAGKVVSGKPGCASER